MMSRFLTKAFTLMETAIALAILSVAVVMVMGALSMAITTSGDNDHDALVPAMSDLVLAELKSVNFNALWFANPAEANTAALGPISPGTSPADSIYLFDADGSRLPFNTPQANAAYICTVKKQADTSLDQPGLLRLQLIFQWPVSSAERYRSTRVISTKIARR